MLEIFGNTDKLIEDFDKASKNFIDSQRERQISMWRMYFRSELSRKEIIGDTNCQSILDDIQNEIDCGKFWLKRTLEDLTDEYKNRF